MMDGKIKVPDGMLQAGRATYSGYVTAEEGARRILEAALLWLSKNPIVLTEEHTEKILKDMESNCQFPANDIFCIFVEKWQRRMFLAEEPSVPEEIRDLLWKNPFNVNGVELHSLAEPLNESIVEAFRRGQRSK